jgi:hypothetical protein
LVSISKPQNGIFIDLGNIIHAGFPLQAATIALLPIQVKGADFL